MKTFFLTLISILFFGFTQEFSKNITGNSVTEEQQPLPFTNIVLLLPTDSSIIKFASADVNGNFILEKVKPGSYLLKISSVGFNDHYKTITLANEDLDLGEIPMKAQTNELQAVTIVAQKPLIEQQIDKTVLNVANSILAGGNNALDILEKAPGISIDRHNEVIKLKNKAGILFMINGKKNYLSESQLIQFLQSLNGDDIEKIEIISNPSAKYDAAGNSGIINIILKKNQNFGTNGTLNLGAGIGIIPNTGGEDLNSFNESLNLNHRNKKSNVFLNLSGNQMDLFRELSLLRNVRFEDQLQVFDQIGKNTRNRSHMTTKLGVDYFLTEKTSLGFVADVNLRDSKNDAENNTYITGAGTLANTSLRQLSHGNTNNTDYSFNLNLKNTFDTTGRELTADLDYSNFNYMNLENYYTQYFNLNNQLDSNSLLRNNTPTLIDIYGTRIDYVHPISKNVKIETGLKSGYVKTDNDFRFERLNERVWETENNKTNYFKYKEWIHAAYINYAKSNKNWTVQAGLRTEWSLSEGHSVTINNKVKRNYISLFPSLFIIQNVDKNNIIRYSFSRRIDRPNYTQLNPFLFFLDPYTFAEGNPFLKPSFTYKYGIDYSFKSAFNVSLEYSHTHDSPTQIISQNDTTKVTKVTQLNLENYRNYALNVGIPFKPTKWWITQANASLYYDSYKDNNLLGGKLNIGQLGYNFNINSHFTFPKKWSAEANIWLYAPGFYGIFKNTRALYAINLGLQKQIKNMKFKLNINDIFLTSLWRGSVDYQNVNLNISSREINRKLTFGFTYNFGNQSVKSSQGKKSASDDLKRRVESNQ